MLEAPSIFLKLNRKWQLISKVVQTTGFSIFFNVDLAHHELDLSHLQLNTSRRQSQIFCLGNAREDEFKFENSHSFSELSL